MVQVVCIALSILGPVYMAVVLGVLISRFSGGGQGGSGQGGSGQDGTGSSAGGEP